MHPLLASTENLTELEVQAKLYRRLRALAKSLLSRLPSGFTLQPTDLVHAAWLKVQDARGDDHKNPEHLFATLALATRQALVDHLRRRGSLRRGGLSQRTDLENCNTRPPTAKVQALNDLLLDLELLAPRAAQVVNLRYFGCLKVEEIANLLGVSKRTIERELRTGIAWLSSGLRRS